MRNLLRREIRAKPREKQQVRWVQVAKKEKFSFSHNPGNPRQVVAMKQSVTKDQTNALERAELIETFDKASTLCRKENALVTLLRPNNSIGIFASIRAEFSAGSFCEELFD